MFFVRCEPAGLSGIRHAGIRDASAATAATLSALARLSH